MSFTLVNHAFRGNTFLMMLNTSSRCICTIFYLFINLNNKTIWELLQCTLVVLEWTRIFFINKTPDALSFRDLLCLWMLKSTRTLHHAISIAYNTLLANIQVYMSQEHCSVNAYKRCFQRFFATSTVFLLYLNACILVNALFYLSMIVTLWDFVNITLMWIL